MRHVAEADRIRQLMRMLGAAATHEASVYFTGGATAVLMGWRPTTIDVDLAIIPDSDELLRALPEIKEKLKINIELASPAHFLPELPEWSERSPSIGREGKVSFFHYDLYSQALAKIERGHSQDREDVKAMLAAGLVQPDRLVQLFEAIEPQLYRFPAVNPASLRSALDRMIA